MPFQCEQLEGQKFGMLTALSLNPKRTNAGAAIWLCRCDCGNTTEAPAQTLKCGGKKSCGCKSGEWIARAHTSHGETIGGERTKEYEIWNSMKQRCLNPNNTAYPYYGGRGIKVCERWMQFENFLADMGRKPTPKHTIDRWPNKKGNYSCGKCEHCLANGWAMNCRWATRKQQSNNLSNNRILMLHGESMTLAQIVDKVGIKYTTLLTRLKYMSLEDALAAPERLKDVVVYNGVEMRTCKLARLVGIERHLLRYRLKRMSVEEAISTPVRKQAKRQNKECGREP